MPYKIDVFIHSFFPRAVVMWNKLSAETLEVEMLQRATPHHPLELT
jgi:hypothetical protein